MKYFIIALFLLASPVYSQGLTGNLVVLTTTGSNATTGNSTRNVVAVLPASHGGTGATGLNNSTLTVSGGNLTVTGVIAPYAVIYIPLPPGSQWTDFELKASINNFTNDETGMVFFYHSPDPSKTAVPSTGQVWTVKPDVYFTDSGKTGTPNQRTWATQNSTDSIALQLADQVNSEVGGFIIVVRDNLSAYNNNLVWSYSLLDGATVDKDPANRSVWRPVWPVQWINTVFNPNP